LVYRVYSTKSCPKCEQLKAALVKAGIAFENIDMGTPEALTELRRGGYENVGLVQESVSEQP